MGLLRQFRNHQATQAIRANDLRAGSGGECCETCEFRMRDPKSSYLVCAIQRQHVGAGQVCDQFSYGDPRYEFR